MMEIAAAKNLIEALLHLGFTLNGKAVLVGLQLLIVIPQQVLHLCNVLTVLFGIALQSFEAAFWRGGGFHGFESEML